MKRNVLIIGGGLAALTAALRLSKQGYLVTLLEQGDAWGGRLIHTTAKPPYTDAIPTVFLGCHHATQALLNTLGMAPRVRFSSGLSLEFAGFGKRPIRLRRPLLPAPWGTILSLAIFRGLPLRDRWKFLNWIERTWEKDPALPADLDNHTAEAWFRRIGQSEAGRLGTWSPLSRFLLGDDLKTVSAALFLRVLISCFLSSRCHSMLAIPNDSMGCLLVEPCVQSLRKVGVTLRPDTPVSQIRINAQGVTGVQLDDGGTVTADWYVAAIPHRDLSPLLPERAVTRFSYFQQLPQLIDSPALVAHVWMDFAISRSRVLLLAGRPYQYHWMVLRPESSGNRRLLASLVATGQPTLLEYSEKDVLDLAVADLRAAIPEAKAAPVSDHYIIREPRAFLSVRPRTMALRPLQQSPFPNFFLAGDWTDTGLPSTVESAIHSGDLCAAAIVTKRHA